MFAASKTAKAASAAAPTDPQFNYVTMLLHGDGTNGAQNNTFLDSSTNNFTITRNGNTTQGTYSPYGANWSNYFDGTGDYLSVANATALQLSGSQFTIEGWFYYTTSGVDAYLVSNASGSADANVNYVIRITTANKLRFLVMIGSTPTFFDGTTTITANSWHHFACVCDGSGAGAFLRSWLDGVYQGASSSFNAASINTNSAATQIAAYSAVSSYSTGYVSNIRILKGTALYTGTSNITVPTTPLTAITNTSLLTCADNRFIDDSTNNFTITRNGDVSVQRFSPFNATSAYSTSVIGGSGYFDGTGDYLNIANQTALHLGGSDFSIECWTYLTSTSGAQRPISQNNSDYEFAFYIANGGDITVYSSQSSGALNFSISGGTLVTGQWYHLACTRTGSTVAFFVNGVRKNTATFSGTVDSQTGGWRIGANGVGTDLQKGYITDARLVFGSNPYGVGTTLTLPTAPLTAITNTQLLTNFTNAGILDNAMMNDLETVGNAQISTSVKKFGTGSMYFDGTGDGLQAIGTPNTVFGTGNFTVEFWIYLNANTGTFKKFVELGTTGSCFTIETQGTSNVLTITDLNNTVLLTSSTALSLTTWIHVAAARSGTTLKLFQDGVQVGSVTDSTNFVNTGNVYVGQSNSGQAVNCYMDDLRITKGYARYTSTFTPPTAAFPNN
jgi:hypothetical protein